MATIEVIINAAGGSFVEGVTEQELDEAFAAAGLDANVSCARTGEQIGEFAEAACSSDAKIIVAGGGDGTISSVAALVSKTDKIFGVLPLGTLNNFSKDLGIPQDINEAIALIAAGNTTRIDLADLNGRVFINNSSIGLYPRIVRNRVQQQQRLGYGKWRAAFWATIKMFRVSPFLKIGLVVDGKFFIRKVPFLFVGNNRYEMDLYNIGRRPSLSDGKLSIYFLHRGGRLGVLRMLFRTLTGRVKQWRDFEEVLTDSITIQTRRRYLNVAFDGEISMMATPLKYSIIPDALTVIVPSQEEDA